MTTRTLLIEIDVNNPDGHFAYRLLRRGPLESPDAGLHLPASGQYADIPLRRLTGGHRQRRESRAHSRNSGPRFRGSDRDRGRSQAKRSSHYQPAGLNNFGAESPNCSRQLCREMPNEPHSRDDFRREKDGKHIGRGSFLRSWSCCRVDARLARTTGPPLWRLRPPIRRRRTGSPLNPMTKILVATGGRYFRILNSMRSSSRSMSRIRI